MEVVTKIDMIFSCLNISSFIFMLKVVFMTRIKKICALLLTMVICIIPLQVIVFAEEIPFLDAPISASGSSGGTGEVAPRGFSVKTDDGHFWLESPYNNEYFCAIYTGQLNGKKSIDISKNFELYAWIDKNPTNYSDYIVLYENGTQVFGLEFGSAARGDITDPSGQTNRWYIPIRYNNFKSGNSYEFAFLRGLTSNNNMTCVLSPDTSNPVGYLRDYTSNIDLYNYQRYDEYRYRQYKEIYSIGSDFANPTYEATNNEGSFYSMRFKFLATKPGTGGSGDTSDNTTNDPANPQSTKPNDTAAADDNKKTEKSFSVKSGTANELLIGDNIKLEITQNAISTDISINYNLFAESLQLKANSILLSKVWSFSSNDKFDVLKPFTLSYKIDRNAIPNEYFLSVGRYEPESKRWKMLGGIMDDNTFSCSINQLGIYAMFAVYDNSTKVTDISNHWAYEGIRGIIRNDVTLSLTDGSKFTPDKLITRAEFAQVIAQAFELQTTVPIHFKDVMPDNKYFAWVSAVANAGIMVGQAEGYFGADGFISRQDVAVIIQRVLTEKKINLKKVRANTIFNDEDEIADYAIDSVKNLYAYAVFNGVGNGFFDPKGNITRGQAASIVYRIIQLSKL